MLLSELMAERGWFAEDVVAILGERGVISGKGKSIGVNGVKMVVGRKMDVPPTWATALGVEASPHTPGGEDGGAPAGSSESQSSRRQEQPPKRPEEAAIAVVEAGAAKRIAGAYKFAGAALAAGSGSQGVAHVWGDQSDRIAELWLEAAKENVWAARFVNMMQSGGPMGDLAAGHLYLAGATLYVLGAGIPGGDAVFAKYSKFRPVTQPPAGANGSAAAPTEPAAADPAEGAVVDAPV